MRVASLRRRLLLGGFAGVALAALLAAWLLGAAFERAAQRAFDARLQNDLDGLIARAEAGADARVRLAREPVDARYDRIFSGAYWAVALSGETRASRSSWDAAALDEVLAAAAPERRVFDLAGPRGQSLRVAVQRVAFDGATAPAAFAVAEDMAPIRAEARDFRAFSALAVAAIAAALLAVMAGQVAWGLRPLRRIGAVLRRLRAGEDARFAQEALPAEVAPLAAQVDDLLDEHARRVERARNAADDLAHALKTPLAALLLDSERAVPDLPVRAARHARAMQALVAHRLAGGFAADTRGRTPVLEVLSALRELLLRVDPRVEIGIQADAGLRFAGRREDLEELLGNLLDNAVRHARGRVLAHAREEGGRLLIDVDDDGRGLDEAQAARALQRGVRFDQREGGSGLGLAIAQNLATSHGGTLELARSPLGGLRARLSFGAASP